MYRSDGRANDNPVQILLDIAVLFVSFGISVMYASRLSGAETCRGLAFVCIFTIIYVLLNRGAGIYNTTCFFYLDRFLKRITCSWGCASVCTMAALYLYDPHTDLYKFYGSFLIVSYLLMVLSLFSCRMFQIVTSEKKAPRTALVGRFEDYERFQYYLNKTSMKMNVIGFILRENDTRVGQFNVIGRLSELEEILREKKIDQLLFMQKADESCEAFETYVQAGLQMEVTVRILFDTHRFCKSRIDVGAVGTYPMITYNAGLVQKKEKLTKGSGRECKDEEYRNEIQNEKESDGDRPLGRESYD
uniref:nucleoside-diphosphate sugar epimerase/dehydratase n=1 Tax=Eubacterium cellulosolvens TaxID=29322 RepID=UPI000483ECF8|nr:hypothetical protein [[Eubacterium] cellulosolvens]